jgi:hypothetical protein
MRGCHKIYTLYAFIQVRTVTGVRTIRGEEKDPPLRTAGEVGIGNVYIFIYMYIIYKHIYVCVYIYVIHKYVYVYIYIYIYIYAVIYMYIYTYIISFTSLGSMRNNWDRYLSTDIRDTDVRVEGNKSPLSSNEWPS